MKNRTRAAALAVGALLALTACSSPGPDTATPTRSVATSAPTLLDPLCAVYQDGIDTDPDFLLRVSAMMGSTTVDEVWAHLLEDCPNLHR